MFYIPLMETRPAVFSTAFELRGADLPFSSCVEKIKKFKKKNWGEFFIFLFNMSTTPECVMDIINTFFQLSGGFFCRVVDGHWQNLGHRILGACSMVRIASE
jgi:hypothetical protein